MAAHVQEVAGLVREYAIRHGVSADQAVAAVAQMAKRQPL